MRILQLHEGETMLGGLFSEELDLLQAMPVFIMSGSPVHIFLSISKHAVNQSRQLGGHGGNGFGRTQAGAKAPELRSQVALAGPQCSRRHSQSRG